MPTDPAHEPISGNSFPKEMRLRRKKEFDSVFKEGKAFRDGLFLLMCRANALGNSRMGLMVAKRFGPAVKRNRLKRLCREAFRLGRRGLPSGLDFVVIPKSAPEMYSLGAVDRSFRKLLAAAAARLGV